MKSIDELFKGYYDSNNLEKIVSIVIVVKNN